MENNPMVKPDWGALRSLKFPLIAWAASAVLLLAGLMSALVSLS